MTPRPRKPASNAETLELINYKLDELKDGQDRLVEQNETFRGDITDLKLWKAKVEDTVRTSVANEPSDWFMKNKLPITIFLGIIWLLLNFLLGGGAKWPF